MEQVTAVGASTTNETDTARRVDQKLNAVAEVLDRSVDIVVGLVHRSTGSDWTEAQREADSALAKREYQEFCETATHFLGQKWMLEFDAVIGRRLSAAEDRGVRWGIEALFEATR